MNKPMLIIRHPNQLTGEEVSGLMKSLLNSELSQLYFVILVPGTTNKFEFSLLTSNEADFLQLNVEIMETMVHRSTSIEGVMDLKTKIDSINAWADNGKPDGNVFLRNLLKK